MFNFQILIIMGTGAIIALIGTILSVLSSAGGMTASALQNKTNRESVNAQATTDDSATGIGIASDIGGLLGQAMGMASSFNLTPSADRLFNSASKSIDRSINKIGRSIKL